MQAGATVNSPNNDNEHSVETGLCAESGKLTSVHSFKVCSVVVHAPRPSHRPRLQDAVPVLLTGDVPNDPVCFFLQLIQVSEPSALQEHLDSVVEPKVAQR